MKSIQTPEMNAFANDWINAWNSHDLNRILDHYTPDVEIYSPMIQMAAGVPGGFLKGKDSVSDYWAKALSRFPDLHFELIAVTRGVGSLSIYYKSILDKKAMETMVFNTAGKVKLVMAHYT